MPATRNQAGQHGCWLLSLLLNISFPLWSWSISNDSETSEPMSVFSGVSQSSVVGPTLFFHHFYDFLTNVSPICFLVADTNSSFPSQIMPSFRTFSVNWKMMGMQFKHKVQPQKKIELITFTHLSKPAVIMPNLASMVIPKQSSVKYLQPALSSFLKWNTSVPNITTKANHYILVGTRPHSRQLLAVY